jgi:hypothetical protein
LISSPHGGLRWYGGTERPKAFEELDYFARDRRMASLKTRVSGSVAHLVWSATLLSEAFTMTLKCNMLGTEPTTTRTETGPLDST